MLPSMSTLGPLMDAWDEAHREFAIALGDFPDEDFWKRPHPRLLSVGELAGHVAYWQAVGALGGGNAKPVLDQLPIKSPLLDHAFRYYTINVDLAAKADLSAPQVLEE